MTITLTMKIFLTHEQLGFGSSHSCLPFPAPLISISGKSRNQKQRRKAKLFSEGRHGTSCRAAGDAEHWEMHASGIMHFMWQPSRCLRLVNCLHLGHLGKHTQTKVRQCVGRTKAKWQYHSPGDTQSTHPATWQPGTLAPCHFATHTALCEWIKRECKCSSFSLLYCFCHYILNRRWAEISAPIEIPSATRREGGASPGDRKRSFHTLESFQDAPAAATVARIAGARDASESRVLAATFRMKLSKLRKLSLYLRFKLEM